MANSVGDLSKATLLWRLCDAVGCELEATAKTVKFACRRKVLLAQGLNVTIPLRSVSSMVWEREVVVLARSLGNLCLLFVSDHDGVLCSVVDLAFLKEKPERLIEDLKPLCVADVTAYLLPAIVASYERTNEGKWSRLGDKVRKASTLVQPLDKASGHVVIDSKTQLF